MNSEELCLNCNRPRSVHSAIFGECGGGRSPKYTFRSKGNGVGANGAVAVPVDRGTVSEAVVGDQEAAAQAGCEVVDLNQTVEQIKAIVAANASPLPAPSGGILKTFGNHLCDLLRDGECLEIERNFWCVSGLSVTAVAANGREATIGIGPEDMVRRTDRDRFAEKVAQVLDEARSQT